MVCFVLLFRKLCKSCFKRLLLLVWTTLEEQLSCPPLGHSNSWERSHLTTQKTSQLLHKLSNPYKTEIRIIQPKCKRSKTKFPKKKKKKKKPLQKLNHPNTQIGSNGKNQEKLKRRIQPIGKKKITFTRRRISLCGRVHSYAAPSVHSYTGPPVQANQKPLVSALP